MPHSAASFPAVPSGSALERIRSLSRPFSLAFSFLIWFLAVVTALMVTAALIYDGPYVRLSNDYVNLVITPDLTPEIQSTTTAIGHLPLKDRLVGIVTLGILQWGALLMIFFHARALFRLFEGGTVFSAGNVDCIRKIGFWLIFWGFAPALGHQITQLMGVHDQDWFRMSSMAGVFLGGMLFVIARVMNLGQEIEGDRESIV